MTRIGFVVLAVVVVGVPLAWWLWGQTIEQPEYEVVGAGEGYELRRYAPYVVAETTVSGDFEQAGSRAFRPLASYIFGRNVASQEMAMTAPVISQPGAARTEREGTRMAMTSPVLSTSADGRHAADGNQWTYQFVMESRFSLTTLPEPLDPAVTLRPVPERLMAARRFSGRWRVEKIQEEEALLLAALREDGLVTLGPVMLARYNDPFTPFFLRRNEVLVEVAEENREGQTPSPR